ncbi:MAG: Peptidase superfamily, partial [Chthoniobacter sp.]|nr:Peptidase superfamily [Chthoniobacter sp.]
TLGHETAHLVVHRFFGSGVPLWLDEGYAEYASTRGYAAFMRARSYAAKPVSEELAPADYVPLKTLTELSTYPTNIKQVTPFYVESEKLVRFLSATNKQQFLAFFDALAKGNKTESALGKTFGSRFSSLDALDQEFQVYVTKDHGSGPQN